MKGTWQTDDHRAVSGGLVLAVIGAVILLGSGAGAAIGRAVVFLIIALAVVMVLAVGGLVAWLVHQARQNRPGRPISGPAVYRVPPAEPLRLEESHKPALGPRQELHLHFHGADPGQVAEILRRHQRTE